MAKGYKKPNIPQILESGTQRVDTYTTASGITIKIRGVPQMLLDKIRRSVKTPEPPKYKAVTVAGVEEWHDHDETTLETEDILETSENKRAWFQYKASIAEADDLIKDRIQKAIILRGIVVDMPESSDWLEEQQFLGITIPTDERELYIHYIQTEVIGYAQDFANVMELIMAQTGVPDAQLAEVRESFRSALEGVKEGSIPVSYTKGEVGA